MWSSKYSAGNPFASGNKALKPWQYSEKQLTDIKEGKTPRMSVPEAPFKLDGKVVPDEQVWAAIRPEPQRDFDMLSSIGLEYEAWLRKRAAGEKPLVLVSTGVLHADDFFTWFSELEGVSYLSYPLTVDSKRGNAAFRSVLKMDTPGARQWLTAEAAMLGYVPSPLWTVNQAFKAKRFHFDPEQILKEEKGGDFFLIRDLHALDTPEVFSSMPSAVCLKKLGFSEVRIVLEGSKRKSKGYDGKRIAHLQTMRGAMEDEGTLESYQAKNPGSLEKMEALKMEIVPATIALIEKGKSLEQGGVTVSFQGLEIENNERRALYREFFVALVDWNGLASIKRLDPTLFKQENELKALDTKKNELFKKLWALEDKD